MISERREPLYRRPSTEKDDTDANQAAWDLAEEEARHMAVGGIDYMTGNRSFSTRERI